MKPKFDRACICSKWGWGEFTSVQTILKQEKLASDHWTPKTWLKKATFNFPLL